MTSPIQLGKTYGVLHTESFFSFLGFAKKIGNSETQKIDVYLDNKLIDTIVADKFIQKIDDMYDVENQAFTYNLSTEYIGKKATISFKNHSSQDELLNSPYTLIDKNHEKFNEAKFLHSLEGNFDNEKIQNINPKDSIGFLATEDNILNKDLIKLINIFLEKNIDSRFKAFYFNNQQKKLISEKFNKYLSQIDFIIPKDIYDLASSTSIYIHSSTANEKPKDTGYYKIWQVLNQTKANMFLINIFETIDEKEYTKSLKLIDNCKIEFEKSIVSKIFENDERYNEFEFINSINQPISEEMKNMYCPNSIGFLATKENLEDEDFMNFLQELEQRFPNINFKLFYLNKCYNEKNYIKIYTIHDIIKNCCVLITNPTLKNNMLDKIIDNQQIKLHNVYIYSFSKTIINNKIRNIVMPNLINVIKNNLDIFNLSKDDIEYIDSNHILMVRKIYEKNLNLDIIDITILLNMTFKEFIFININIALKNKYFIQLQKYVTSKLLELDKKINNND